MVKSYESILLFDLPVFTRISIETPMPESIGLPSEACFAYIVRGDKQVLSSSENILAVSGQVILSLCGLTVGRLFADQPKGVIESVIVHFSHEVLQHVFSGEKPALWKELDMPVT
jgi:AraC family transcriptional regulator, exoenzyme S synthesis regulatory protein ExsA